MSAFGAGADAGQRSAECPLMTHSGLRRSGPRTALAERSRRPLHLQTALGIEQSFLAADTIILRQSTAHFSVRTKWGCVHRVTGNLARASYYAGLGIAYRWFGATP